jgi:HK97 family phage portal protein
MGAAYWLKDVDRLVRLNPNTMEVQTSAKGITGFKQTVYTQGKQETRTFAPEQIVYFREFHPTDDLGPGVAAIDVAKPAILAEYEARRYVRAFFQNDAIPGMLLTTPQEVPQTELDKLRDWWYDKFRGAKNHHKVAFVDRDLTAQILTTDLTSMALSEVLDQARKDICAAFQVPDILVGNMTESTYANAAEARQFMMEEVTIPRADYYQDAINTQLVEPYDMNVGFEWAYDELEILQEDANAKADRLIKLLGENAVDLDYLRDELGIPQDAGPSPEEVEAKKEQARQDMQAQMQQKPTGDMAKWRKKAIKALKAGASPNVPFETREVSAPLQVALRARLAQATTWEEVDDIFCLEGVDA